MLIVKAILQARSGKEQEMEEALRAMVPNVQQEEGALVYTLHRAEGNPGRFFFYEKYVDRPAFDFHVATPYFQELFRKLESLLEGAVDVELYEELAGLDR